MREGRSAAFEVVYDRHHRAMLSFCRHLLGDAGEAEDAVQHTFLAAYGDLMSSEKAIHLRAWLFTIARNRCYSVLRSRREQPMAELDECVTEALAAQVQRRQDLRDLILDMRQLPDEQRAALILAELDSLSHEQIAEVLEVPREKVKALVFQARESLIASRTARETACEDIREQLANGHGGALRRGNLRRHLRECSGCRDFQARVEGQRKQLALLLPVAPTIALKEAVLTGTVGAGAGIGLSGGGLIATSALKSAVIKGVVATLLAGAGTAGSIAITHLKLPAIIPIGNSGGGRLTASAPPTRPRAGAPGWAQSPTSTVGWAFGAMTKPFRAYTPSGTGQASASATSGVLASTAPFTAVNLNPFGPQPQSTAGLVGQLHLRFVTGASPPSVAGTAPVPALSSPAASIGLASPTDPMSSTMAPSTSAPVIIGASYGSAAQRGGGRSRGSNPTTPGTAWAGTGSFGSHSNRGSDSSTAGRSVAPSPGVARGGGGDGGKGGAVYGQDRGSSLSPGASLPAGTGSNGNGSSRGAQGGSDAGRTQGPRLFPSPAQPSPSGAGQGSGSSSQGGAGSSRGQGGQGNGHARGAGSLRH
ncbi:MAG: RNA polymerase sigma factor [Solirubrobacteraceae bacterium]